MRYTFVLLVILTAGTLLVTILDVAAALERSCTPSHIVCTPSAHGEELPELSPFAREMRRSPLTVLSPPLADPSRFYFMPPRTGRSKRGSANWEQASHVKRCRAAQTSTPSPPSLVGSTGAGALDRTAFLSPAARAHALHARAHAFLWQATQGVRGMCPPRCSVLS